MSFIFCLREIIGLGGGIDSNLPPHDRIVGIVGCAESLGAAVRRLPEGMTAILPDAEYGGGEVESSLETRSHAPGAGIGGEPKCAVKVKPFPPGAEENRATRTSHTAGESRACVQA